MRVQRNECCHFDRREKSLAVSGYDNSSANPRVLEQGAMKRSPIQKESSRLTLAAGRALRRAAKAARKTARMHGTPIYVWKNGKVVAEKP